jgi:hypothetical protein
MTTKLEKNCQETAAIIAAQHEALIKAGFTPDQSVCLIVGMLGASQLFYPVTAALSSRACLL